MVEHWFRVFFVTFAGQSWGGRGRFIRALAHGRRDIGDRESGFVVAHGGASRSNSP
jgi:hypothetical protein